MTTMPVRERAGSDLRKGKGNHPALASQADIRVTSFPVNGGLVALSQTPRLREGNPKVPTITAAEARPKLRVPELLQGEG